VEPAAAGDGLLARTEVQVIGVAQDDARAGVDQMLLGDRLDGALSADGHEDRGLDRAVGRGQAAASCPAVGGKHLEVEGHVQYEGLRPSGMLRYVTGAAVARHFP
jgi:hypothetical protein